MSAPEDESAPAGQIATWVYLGETAGTRFARVAAWRCEDGKVRAYKSTPASRGVVGGVHRVRLDPDDSLVGAPTWTGDYAADVETIRLESRAEAERLNYAAAVRKAQKSRPAADLLDAVTSYAARLSEGARRQLAEELQRAVWRAGH